MSKSSCLILTCFLLAFGRTAHSAQGPARPGSEVPAFNIQQVCRALARVPDARSVDVNQVDATQNCVNEERQARDQLTKEWPQFTPSEQRLCVGISRQGEADPAYTELLTCLEMARDAGQAGGEQGHI